MSAKQDEIALLMGYEAQQQRRNNAAQDNTVRLVQWLVVLVALLLLSNLMMMGMMVYGFSYLRTEVANANADLHHVVDTIRDTVSQVAGTFGNITSSIRLLPASVFDFATRVMTADFVDFAYKVDQITTRILETSTPAPGSSSAYVFSIASLLQGLSRGVEAVREVPNPLPPFSGPVDVPDFAVFQTLEWLDNQTDPVKMQQAGQTCVTLLNNVNTALSAGAFSFFYLCWDHTSTWTTCPIHWTESAVEPYIGKTSALYLICSQISDISPSFFSKLEVAGNNTARMTASRVLLE